MALIAVCLFQGGCKSSVTAPAVTVPPGTIAVTPTDPNGPIIQVAISRMAPGGLYNNPIIQAQIYDHTYAPITNAAVTVIAPGSLSIPVTYTGSGGFYGDQSGTWSYQPGQSYTAKVLIGGTTYTASLALPGGVTVPTPASGLPITWSFEGNFDEVNISEGFSPYTVTVNTLLSSLDVNSPFSTASAYPAAGQYNVAVQIEKIVYSCFANANPGCMFTGSDQYSITVTK